MKTLLEIITNNKKEMSKLPKSSLPLTSLTHVGVRIYSQEILFLCSYLISSFEKIFVS